MTKQEEIREGIKDILIKESGNIATLYTEPSNSLVEHCLRIADEIMVKEASQGVAIKVEDIPIKGQPIILYARCAIIEPLIELSSEATQSNSDGLKD